MSYTVQDIVTRTRQMLQDTDVNSYRRTDQEIIDNINDSLVQTLAIRPDLFVGLKWTVPYYTTADLNADFPLDTRYFVPVVNFVTGRIELSEDEFATEGRAVAVLTMFQAAMVGG